MLKKCLVVMSNVEKNKQINKKNCDEYFIYFFSCFKMINI